MIKIVYADIAEGAAENASYSDTGRQAYASVAALSTGAAPRLIATGEVGRWKLDGSVDILDAVDTDYGYISLGQSDENGVFPDNVGVDVLLSNNYASSGLTLIFDTLEDVFYTVTVKWYDGDTVVSEGTFTTDDAEYSIEQAVKLYNKIEIRFISSSKPYRFARLAQCIFGAIRRFSPSDFTSASLTQEVNPISEELAIDTSRFTLRPRKNIQFIFQSRQAFKIYRDDDLIAAHYLKDANIASQNNYVVSCQSAVGILDEQPFEAVMLENKPALEAAQEIIGDSFTIDMQEDLQAMTVSGYIADGTRRDALHQLLFALGAVCSTVGRESIRIFTIPAEAKQIPRENIYTGASVQQDAVVTSVKVEYHSYSAEETEGASKIELDGVTYYDTVGYLEKINTDVIAGTHENPVEITGATLLTKERAEALLDALYAYHVHNTTVTQKIIITDEAPGELVLTEDILEMPFEGIITSRETILTNLFASTLTIRGAYVTD